MRFTIFPILFKATSAALAGVMVLCLGVAQPAAAGTASDWTRNSHVTDMVTDNLNGTWTYNYRVHNDSQRPGGKDQMPILVDWELPWFGDAGIDLFSILSPRNWDWAIEMIGAPNPNTGWKGVAAWQDPLDLFYPGPSSPFTSVRKVLHWYNTCPFRNQDQAFAGLTVIDFCEGPFDNAIFPDNSLDGFGFIAKFDETAAPYQASWAFLPVRTGDPAFPLGGVPNSPRANGTAIPEPGALGLLGLGLAALALIRRRRA